MDYLCRKINERKELILKIEEEIKLLEEAVKKGIPNSEFKLRKKQKKIEPRDSYEINKLINLLRLELEINES